MTRKHLQIDTQPRNELERAVEGWLDFDQYQVERSGVFPSRHALDWFSRKHRDRLQSAGAIKMVRGRKKIVPPKFDAVAIDVFGCDR